MKKIRAMWQSLWGDADRRVKMGRVLGLVFITGGFIVMGKAWDGAASVNFAQGQIPYLLSGGFMGLAPTGRRVSIPVVFLYEFEAGLITRDRRVYDFTSVLLQVGALKAKPR